jgi:GT2 family glycosyltransferase
VIGYFGALARWVDVPLVEAVARSHPEATIVLAGGHFDVDLGPLERLPNVRLLGQRPYAEMPRLLWGFDVCLIPFVVNDITEATNPVKFYEYLFSGKPVVAPALPELEPFADVAYLARDRGHFVDQLDRALAERADDPRREQRRRLAEVNDWSRRYDVMDEVVRGLFPLVSVVVVTYGQLELTQACLDSLREGETWPHLEIVVVDNASPDGTPAYLRSLAEHDGRVRGVWNSTNLGFPAAINVGVRAARGEIVVLLNNDTVVPPGLIGRLVHHLLGDASIGLICPTTNFCGNEARIEADYTDLSALPAFAAARAHDFAGQTFEIPVAAMYCVAARAEVLRAVGPLDERFGIGLFEDDDFSQRTRAAGFRVVCANDAYVHHFGQGTFRLLSSHEYSSLWRRNQAHFEAKWGAPWTPHRARAGVAPLDSRIG